MSRLARSLSDLGHTARSGPVLGGGVGDLDFHSPCPKPSSSRSPTDLAAVERSSVKGGSGNSQFGFESQASSSSFRQSQQLPPQASSSQSGGRASLARGTLGSEDYASSEISERRTGNSLSAGRQPSARSVSQYSRQSTRHTSLGSGNRSSNFRTIMLRASGIIPEQRGSSKDTDAGARLQHVRDLTLLGRIRASLPRHCRNLMRSKWYQIAMFFNLLIALFLPDLWVAFDLPGNTVVDVVISVVLFLFLLELGVQVTGYWKTYPVSFFFWTDLVGTLSVLLDLSYLPFRGLLLGQETGNADKSAILKAARIAKLGARAGRFSRLVKLVRFLPGMYGADVGTSTAKTISTRLITALAIRVSCLIIVMAMLMPLFGMWTYPDDDFSSLAWVKILEKTALRKPERMELQIRKFHAFYESLNYQPYLLTARNPQNLNSSVLALLPWTSPSGVQAPVRTENVMIVRNDNFEISFNFKNPNAMDAGMNVVLFLIVIVLMIGFSLVLSNSVSAIVLRPLEHLLLQVRKMATTIFQSVTEMAVTMSRSDRLDSELDIGADDYPTNAFGNETDLLERVVQKLAVLGEITMSKSVVDAETMRGLGDGDRAVISRFQGGAEPAIDVWQNIGLDEDDVEGHLAGSDAAQAMLEISGLSLDLLNSWNLNPLELDTSRAHAAGMYLMGAHTHQIPFASVTMGAFLEAAEAHYVRANSYHNWFHAIDVAHAVYRILELCSAESYLSSAERYALLVSAVCHDLEHPGLNNSFLIETSHELALRYNDKSPLENMHCSRMFELVSVPQLNIFAPLSRPQFQEIRKICIDAILHTDNAAHFSMVKEVQMLYEVNSEILDTSRQIYARHSTDFPTTEVIDVFRQQEVRRLLVKQFLHLSDLSNSSKPFRICRIWAWQILDECFAQGDIEKQLGIPVQVLNDREKVNMPWSQVGFIEFLVSPFFFSVMKLLPPIEQIAGQLVSNAQSWHQMWLNETRPPPSESEKRALADRLDNLNKKFGDMRITSR